MILPLRVPFGREEAETDRSGRSDLAQRGRFGSFGSLRVFRWAFSTPELRRYPSPCGSVGPSSDQRPAFFSQLPQFSDPAYIERPVTQKRRNRAGETVQRGPVSFAAVVNRRSGSGRRNHRRGRLGAPHWVTRQTRICGNLIKRVAGAALGAVGDRKPVILPPQPVLWGGVVGIEAGLCGDRPKDRGNS